MVLLASGERLLWRRPLQRNEMRVRRERGDTISLVNLARRAIADVGEARPSRSGRVPCYSCHGTIVIAIAGGESRRHRERTPR